LTARSRHPALSRPLSAPELASSPDDTGIIEGYASLFNVTDSGGDMMIRGAFARSLNRRGAHGVKMLWQHQPREPIGSWLSLVENARGLKVRGQLDLTVRRARETFSLIRRGAVNGLSIGFRTVISDRLNSGRIRRLQEVDLWEISVVTFPMLEQARITDLKHGGHYQAQRNDFSRVADIRTNTWKQTASRFDARLRVFRAHNIAP